MEAHDARCARFSVDDGSGSTRDIELFNGERLLLGSDTTRVDLVVPDAGAVEALLKREGDHIVVVQVDRLRGVFVNGRRVPKIELIPGDTVRVGDTVLVYVEDVFGAAPSANGSS